MNKTLFEIENKYVLDNVESPCNNTSDFEKLDSLYGDVVCRIYLKEAPNEEFERVAMDKDGDNYNSNCFFIEATMGRDSIKDDWTTSNWFLFYVTNEGENLFLDDSAELLEAWDYFRENIVTKENTLDNMLVDATERSKASVKEQIAEPEQVLE